MTAKEVYKMQTCESTNTIATQVMTAILTIVTGGNELTYLKYDLQDNKSASETRKKKIKVNLLSLATMHFLPDLLYLFIYF